MKRFHVHVAVDDLAAATRFYATLFGVAPSVAKPDYAKWMLDDPRVNFAISQRGREAGLEHLGIQVDDVAELGALHARLESAGETVADKGAATCCYAKSEKGWVRDPAGLSWETFFTHGEATVYGDSSGAAHEAKAACCDAAATPAPAKAGAAPCCGENVYACPCFG
jgi:catechol 2,3-dioxygenase-like lactoylglutathione lyase family enzyme